MDLAETLTAVGTVFTASTGWMVDVIGVVVDTPILLISVCMTFGFTIIGMYKALRR